MSSPRMIFGSINADLPPFLIGVAFFALAVTAFTFALTCFFAMLPSIRYALDVKPRA
jgi:hypothetical protein